MSVMTITKETFQKEVLDSKSPVLIDFWADWCGPCKTLSPIIEELSEDIQEVKFCKINVDEQPELAQQFLVMSIPTLFLFQEGQQMGKMVGVRPKAEIKEMIFKKE